MTSGVAADVVGDSDISSPRRVGHSLIGIECRRTARSWARERTPHLALVYTPGCAHQRRTWCVPAGLPERRARILIPGAPHSTRPGPNFGHERGRERRCGYPSRLPVLITHHSRGQGMGKHANYLNGMTSWRSAVTLARAARCSTKRSADEVDTFDRPSIAFATVERRR